MSNTIASGHVTMRDGHGEWRVAVDVAEADLDDLRANKGVEDAAIRNAKRKCDPLPTAFEVVAVDIA
jgi:hypothetical protein